MSCDPDHAPFRADLSLAGCTKVTMEWKTDPSVAVFVGLLLHTPQSTVKHPADSWQCNADTDLDTLGNSNDLMLPEVLKCLHLNSSLLNLLMHLLQLLLQRLRPRLPRNNHSTQTDSQHQQSQLKCTGQRSITLSQKCTNLS